MSQTQAEWEDFYLAPKVGASSLDITGAFSSVPVTLATIDASALNAAVLRLSWDGPANSVAEVAIEFAFPPESGVYPFFTQTLIYVLDGRTVYVPVMATSSTLVVKLNNASALPGLLQLLYVSREGSVDTLSIAGASPAASGAVSVGASAVHTIYPANNIPGQVAMYVSTTALDYDIALRTYNLSGAFDIPLADEIAPLAISSLIVVPAGTWSIVFTNNDALAQDLTYALIYQQ